MRHTKYTHELWKSKQWDEGFVSAFAGFGGKLAAYHDEQAHPVTNTSTTTVQPTDLAPVASVFKWLIIVLFLVAVAALFFWGLWARKKERSAAAAAQRGAAQAQGRAASLFLSANKSLPGYDAVAAEYERLSNSVSYDPNASGQSADEYTQIARAWMALAHLIENLSVPAAKQSQPEVQPEAHHGKKAKHSSPPEQQPEVIPGAFTDGRPLGAPERRYEEPYYPPAPIVVPVIIPEERPWRDRDEYSRPERVREPEPTFREPETRVEEPSGNDSPISASEPDPEPSGNDSVVDSTEPEPDPSGDDSAI